MLFNTLPFAAFLAITFGLYYLPPLRKFQIWILIVASFVFYSWTAPVLLVLLLISIALNAFTSYKVSLSGDPKTAVRWATVGVVINLAVLGTFKYGGLLSNTFQDLFLGRVEWPLYLPLPIGISFYTFEGISLLIDTLRQKQGQKTDFKVDRNFVNHFRDTSLFVSFFPHLIAGPILKARHYFPQIGEKYLKDINWTQALHALLIGYFLKVVVADNMKDFTSWMSYPAFQTLSSKTGLVLLYGYSIQIFADFAGYSLIAIGLGYMFGYELPMNFNFPYISKSLSEFWRRWHISLSTWLRDYLYFPLGGNRKGTFRTYINLMTVMVLGGLWHGAGWSYMVWGAYHGLGLVIERLIFGDKIEKSDGPSQNLREHLTRSIRVLLVFAFVSFGWLFFKLPQFSEAVAFIKFIPANWHLPLDIPRSAPVFLYSFPVILYYWWNLPKVIEWRTTGSESRQKALLVVKIAGYAFITWACFVNGGSVGEFIYFQF